MIRTCIVDTQAELVINISEYEEVPSGTPPGYEQDTIAIASNIAQIGWTWDGTTIHPSPVDEDIVKASYLLAAQNALNKTDIVAIRCFKAGVAFTGAWASYTQALRAIVSSSIVDPTLPLPTQPSYPPGS